MFLIMFTAIIGGLGTAGVLTSSHGWLIGILSLPLAGSLWACLPIAFLLWNTRGHAVEHITNEMVSDLRSMAEAGQRCREHSPPARPQDAA